jgi:hypothetical protein
MLQILRFEFRLGYNCTFSLYGLVAAAHRFIQLSACNTCVPWQVAGIPGCGHWTIVQECVLLADSQH